MFGYIYKTTDLLNGKIYIGQHHKNKFDKYYIGSGRKLLLRLKQIGRKNFKTEILEWCETQKELCDKEIYWIKHYNSVDSKIGYNIIDSSFEEIKSSKKYYCRGLITYCNEKLQKEIRLYPDEEVPEGFVKGRLPFSDDWKKKVGRHGENNGMYGVHRFGKQNPCYGRKWCYNPKTMESRYLKPEEELPDGFVYGYVKNKKRLYCWINKEHTTVQIKKDNLNEYLKLGWKRGIGDKTNEIIKEKELRKELNLEKEENND